MSLMHVPVRLVATDSVEIQGFTEILSSGQVGALALAGPEDRALVALVCPSGDPAAAGDMPAVLLGHAGVEVGSGGGERQRCLLAAPARLGDVLAALERLAAASYDMCAPRAHAGWRLDPVRLTLETPDGRFLSLTDTEARLAACLIDGGGATVGREALLLHVWGYRPGLDTHTLETHVYRLRRKVEADPAVPRVIVTTEDGYQFTGQA